MKNHLLKYKIEEYEATKHEYFDDNNVCHPSVYAHGVAVVQARLITEMKFEIERLENSMDNAMQQLNKVIGSITNESKMNYHDAKYRLHNVSSTTR